MKTKNMTLEDFFKQMDKMNNGDAEQVHHTKTNLNNTKQ
jgi:hypothetical protein